MLLEKFSLFVIIFITILKTITSQETLCVVNGKKALNVVDDHFISYTLDFDSIRNNILTRGLPLILVAKNLQPALIRIPNFFSKKTAFQNLTLVKWEKLNTWFHDANLIPIFLLNGEFLPNEYFLLPYFVANFKHQFICYWELHYDFSEISRERLEHDLSIFRGIWEKYPSLKKYLKIVASNSISDSFGKSIEVLHDVLGRFNYSSDAVIYENRLLNDTKTLNLYKEDGGSIWFFPEDNNKLSLSSFESSLSWIQQTEDVATAGYTTIFKSESFDHLFTDTPEYWISTIYKSLINTNVLEVQSVIPSNSTTRVYAHCSKIQQGAMSLVVVNNNNEKNTVMLKIPQPHLKNMEINSYILTSTKENSKQTYLNGEKLELGSPLHPKFDKLRINNHMLSIQLPTKSIGFFVLLGTRVPACLQNVPSWARKPQPLATHKSKDWFKYFETSKKNHLETFVNSSKSDTPMVKVEVVYSEKSTSSESTKPVTKVELELTKDEIKQILINRAKAKAAEQNITMSDEEFKDEMKKAFDNFNMRTKRDINMDLLQINSKRQKVANFDHRRQAPRKPLRREEVDLDYVDDRMEFMMGADIKKNKFDVEDDFDRSNKYPQRKLRPNKHGNLEDDFDRSNKYHGRNVRPNKYGNLDSLEDEDDIEKQKLNKAIRKLENYLRDNKEQTSEDDDYYQYDQYRTRYKRSDLFGERWKKNKDRKLQENLNKKVCSSEDKGEEILDTQNSLKTNPQKDAEDEVEKPFGKFNNFFLNIVQEFISQKNKMRDNVKKNSVSCKGGSSKEDYFNRRKRTNNDERSKNIEKNLRSISYKLKRDAIKKRLNENKFKPWNLFSKRKVKRNVYDDVDSSENAIDVDVKPKFDISREDFKSNFLEDNGWKNNGKGTTSTTPETAPMSVSQCSTEKTTVKESPDGGSSGVQNIFDSFSHTIKTFFAKLCNEIASYFR